MPDMPNAGTKESSAPRQLNSSKLLIGEGKEELAFFEALLQSQEINDFQIEEYGGKDKLAPYLKTLPLRPGFSKLAALAITRDADLEARAVFQSICNSLGHAKLPVPPSFAAITPGPLKVGCFVMPNCKDPGMLEDVCIESLRSNPEWTCIDEFFACTKRASGREPTEPNRSKARVRAWLSTHPDPEKLLGTAGKAGYWNWKDAAFAPLISFLKSF